MLILSMQRPGRSRHKIVTSIQQKVDTHEEVVTISYNLLSQDKKGLESLCGTPPFVCLLSIYLTLCHIATCGPNLLGLPSQILKAVKTWE